MFTLQSQDIYYKTIYWKKMIFAVINMLIGIYFFFSFFILSHSKNVHVYLLNLLIILTFFSFEIITSILVDFFLKKWLTKKTLLELSKILKNSKLPKKMPKVLYVYTTHNDFWEERLLQSMRQTYPNIEYWISDGSSNYKIREKIQEFSKIHKINYFQTKKPSTNKADNLNTFLKNNNINFDYLLISDADVAIHPDFVYTSLKFFNCKEQKKLGWVSAMMQNFPTDNFYTNTLMWKENYNFLFNDFTSNFISHKQQNLYSATCLIKKEMLEEFNMLFPDSCLEDAWLENLAIKKYWIGLINPFAVSLQKFDESILASFNRGFRISDWAIKLFKENFFKRQNEKMTTSYQNYFDFIIIGSFFKKIFILITFAFLIFGIVKYYDIIIDNIFYFIFMFIFCLVFFLKTLLFSINMVLICRWKSFSVLFYSFFYFIADYWFSFFRFIKAFFFSKYADFRTVKKAKNARFEQLFKIRYYLCFFAIIAFLIIVWNLLFILLNLININNISLFFFIFINVILGNFFLSAISFLFVYSLSFVKINKKYKKDDFVYLNNKYISDKFKYKY